MKEAISDNYMSKVGLSCEEAVNLWFWAVAQHQHSKSASHSVQPQRQRLNDDKECHKNQREEKTKTGFHLCNRNIVRNSCTNRIKNNIYFSFSEFLYFVLLKKNTKTENFYEKLFEKKNHQQTHTK